METFFTASTKEVKSTLETFLVEWKLKELIDIFFRSILP